VCAWSIGHELVLFLDWAVLKEVCTCDLCEVWAQELHVILIQMLFESVLMLIIFNGHLCVNGLGPDYEFNAQLIVSNNV
jgi:hypothetical protein